MLERRYTDRTGRMLAAAGSVPRIVAEIRATLAAAKGLGIPTPRTLARDGQLTAESRVILDRALDAARDALEEREAPEKPKRSWRGRFFGGS